MAAHVFFDSEIVTQMAARGITAQRRRLLPAGPPAPAASPRTSGFVLTRGVGSRHAAATQPLATSTIQPRTGIELAEECARLTRDNQRLSDEVTRLRAEIARLSSASTQPRERSDLDDSAQRFALLELE